MTELSVHVWPVATVVTQEGTSEISRLYFRDGHFDAGQGGQDVAIRGPKGARIQTASWVTGKGLTVQLSTGHTFYLPDTRLAGTYLATHV